jgi:hypothetical protein
MVHNFHPTRIALTSNICYSILEFKQTDICLMKHVSYVPFSECTPAHSFMDIHWTDFILPCLEE